jgi:hypothetical protein
MKKIVYLFLLVFWNGQTQSLEQLKLETKKFYDAHYNMDFDGIASIYHPNYFEKYTKERITINLDEWFQNDVLGVRFVFPTMTFTFGPIQEIDGAKYCIITFKNSIRINNVNPKTDDQVKRDLAAYKEVTRYKSVKFEPKRNSYFIEEYTTWIAISSKSTQNKWKFIEKYAKFHYFDELLAPEIQKQLGLL